MRVLLLITIAVTGGVIIVADPTAGNAQTYKQIFNFGGPHGAMPYGQLIELNGSLYGTTTLGGQLPHQTCRGRCGTVFSINVKTGKQKVTYSFQGGGDGQKPEVGLTAVGNLLYGTTYYGGSANDGTIFSVNPATGAKTTIHSFQGGADGIAPTALSPRSMGLYSGRRLMGAQAIAGRCIR